MLDRIRQRITYANVVATLALLVALGGSGYAAVQINGKTIKNGTIAGVKLRKDTLTGRQVNEARLGKVPRAGRADAAASADTAASTARAQTAATLDGIAPAGFLRNAPPEAFREVGGALGAGWVAPDPATSGAATPAFFQDPFGVVHFKGTVLRQTTAGPTIFTLPDGYRPSRVTCFPSVAQIGAGADAALICARPTGAVDLTNGTPATVASLALDGMTFRAGS